MSEIQFSKEEVESLHHLRFHHPHPRVQLKMEVLWLKSQEVSYKEILKLTRITGNTLRSYTNDFIEGGIERLKQINFRKPTSLLNEYKECIEKEFEQNPPATINEASERIEKLTGIKRGLTQTRHFLKSIGFRHLKMGMVPAKADPEKQDEFLKKN